MATSLGVLSLSYWAQVLNGYDFDQLKIISFVQTSRFQPITLPQVGLVAGSLGLTLGYGMGW